MPVRPLILRCLHLTELRPFQAVEEFVEGLDHFVSGVVGGEMVTCKFLLWRQTLDVRTLVTFWHPHSAVGCFQAVEEFVDGLDHFVSGVVGGGAEDGYFVAVFGFGFSEVAVIGAGRLKWSPFIGQRI